MINFDPASLNHDETIFYVTTSLGRKTQALFEYNIQKKSMRKRFVRNQADILSFIKPPYLNSSTVGLQVMPGLIENHYFEPDAPFAKTHKKLAQTFLGSDVTITSQTADGKELVVLMMSDKNPGDFYLFDNETNSASYLLSRKAWIDPNKMSKRKPI